MNTPMRQFVVSFLTVLLAACGAVGQTSITLRSSATAQPGKAVRLADIAEVAGPEAEALAGAVVVACAQPDASGNLAIDPGAVRAALETACPGVNWGRVTLSGTVCYVRLAQPAAAPESKAKEPARDVPAPLDASDQASIRAEVASRLASLYNVPLEDLRVGFGSLSPKDAEFLATPLRAGARYEVQPSGSVRSGRLPIRVDVYERDRLMGTRTFSADVLLRRGVVLAATTIERDQPITHEQLTEDVRWLTPDVSCGPRIEEVAGTTARRRIEAGKTITSVDFQSPVVVSKGETVWVHCLTGSMVVKVRAKALSGGRDGQLIPFQMEGSRKSFLARMSGRGTAVMEATDQPAAGEDASEPMPRSAPARKPTKAQMGARR